MKSNKEILRALQGIDLNLNDEDRINYYKSGYKHGFRTMNYPQRHIKCSHTLGLRDGWYAADPERRIVRLLIGVKDFDDS